MIYSALAVGVNLSDLANQLQVQNEAMRSLERGSTEPTVKPIGLLWDTTNPTVLTAASAPSGVTEAIVRWNGTDWQFIIAIAGGGGSGAGTILASGVVPFAGNQAMGGYKLTGLAAATANGDATRYEQVVHLDAGGVYFDAGSKKISNVAAGSAGSNDAARMADLANVAQTWFGGNRHGTHVVKYVDPAVGVPSDYDTVCGFKPRHLRVKLYGRGRIVSGGFWVGDAEDTTIDFDRLDADSTAGFAGTATSQTIIRAEDALHNQLYILCEWLATGFRLSFFNAGGATAHFRNPANSAVDGSIQVLATGDPNGG